MNDYPVLIAYDASDGIENALYPGRWVVISYEESEFAAAAKAAGEIIGFLFDDITRPIAYAVKTGDEVVAYEGGA